MALISIITACYNHGSYLDEARDSINLLKYSHVFDHIIVNDGSTDAFTISKLRELEDQGATVIHQENKGLAIARNVGINQAKGKYILPLDSDNKIIPEVFIEALNILEAEPGLDVIHTYATFFGTKEGQWIVDKFSLPRMLFENHIDACALIRKSTIEKVGLYSIDMPVMGHEDWELWIKIGKVGKFHLLEKLGFYYRVASESMVNTVSNPHVERTLSYLINKHQSLFLEQYKNFYYKNIQHDHLIRFNEIKAMDAKKNKLKAIAKILIEKPV